MVSTISVLNSFNTIEAYGFPQRHHSLTIITPADFCYLTVRVWLSHLERKMAFKYFHRLFKHSDTAPIIPANDDESFETA